MLHIISDHGKANYLPIIMARIKISDYTKCWSGYGKTGAHRYCWQNVRLYNHFGKPFDGS